MNILESVHTVLLKSCVIVKLLFTLHHGSMYCNHTIQLLHLSTVKQIHSMMCYGLYTDTLQLQRNISVNLSKTIAAQLGNARIVWFGGILPNTNNVEILLVTLAALVTTRKNKNLIYTSIGENNEKSKGYL